ncbi:DUF1692-domain-containing protein [Nadsonia fulvescens var. elongata DSM 6958]|uniref:Endoplasmic reticulum-Golgi intermediate compartment protein n=1 Tax=Nadsonia fulvescens var. elongata DSM 6958 TaxID=857566 RepID=A0A1E3PJU1_9ASCO|nr:DUF1692-domain-containing protein [Nadsonia fulvescens var. elongata DSM 6958]
MSKKFLSYDAFSKTVEDARIRTTSGAVVTLVSLITIISLLIGEWIDYRSIVHRAELVVDKARDERLDINLNMTFVNIPCGLLSMDIMDVSGELQASIEDGIIKTRLDEFGNILSHEAMTISNTQNPESKTDEEAGAVDECPPCYGARPEGECCKTCQDVRDAYAAKGWAFHDGSGIAQCERENYGELLNHIKNEGCNVAGQVSVQKVAGNFHFAPGLSYTRDTLHMHDLSLYDKKDYDFNFAHYIHHLSFGPKVDTKITGVDEDSLSFNPLDNTVHMTDQKQFTFRYFVKVVSTTYRDLQGAVIHTNQYSATSHQRPLQGGRDEDHPNTLHSRGGTPGVFFSYDISAMKVLNMEERAKSLGAFLTGTCAIIGGVLTVATVIDRGLWEANKAIKRKKKV